MFSASKEKVDKGFRFQEKMLAYLSERFENVVDSRAYIQKLEPDAPEVVYNVFESRNGDVIINPNESPVHVECVTTAVKSIFPETKMKNFLGVKHFYAFQLDDTREIFVVHSKVWNSYISKCPPVSINGNRYRKFGSGNVRNLRSKFKLVEFTKNHGGKFE